MKKKGVLLLAVVLLISLAFAGCGSDNGNGDGNDAGGDMVPMKIGATPVPHYEILEFVKPLLAEEGIELEIQEFTDYVLPNMALENEELDANFFQHVPYLEDFNEKNDTDLSAIIPVHFEPLGLYPGQTATLEEIQDGDKIAVPNDTTNEARALLLLQSAGLIEVDANAGLQATIRDITSNPKNLEIVELEAAQIPRALPDVNFGVINGNYAIEAGLSAGEDALASEDKDSLAAQTFANVIVTRTGDDREMFDVLKNILQSEAVREFLEDKYGGAVVPMF
ncbi:MetQ/NlpA family ABC transporter substrate-binding protein [Alkalibacter rhizosphaerae]|uniref:Lipoprotein n=1 Tax=Alkalibacter rhizosphaerae TaxID=2815577 RepID=A0A975AGM0_9FIRM|nr:MetQ/NlpA family ABC transporter substrate-binding protein [Alkalibacter rhizosphaerae]QSX07522.1 MetQ/NlpA family ABC transporter substrate-binding protein [Alkalibacter rhizosphaerae]